LLNLAFHVVSALNRSPLGKKSLPLWGPGG
jgi:hypothetical protein